MQRQVLDRRYGWNLRENDHAAAIECMHMVLDLIETAPEGQA